jgi:hypothetical protein
MTKKTQTLIGIGAVGLVVYFIWNNNKKKNQIFSNASGRRPLKGLKGLDVRMRTDRPTCPNGTPALKNQEPPINGKEDGYYHCLNSNGTPFTLWNQYYL